MAMDINTGKVLWAYHAFMGGCNVIAIDPDNGALLYRVLRTARILAAGFLLGRRSKAVIRKAKSQYVP